MATKTITFDPDSGVPYGANLSIYGGTDFSTTFNVKTTSNTAFDLTSYSGAGALAKSVAVGATLGATDTFTVGITSAAGGVMKISLTDTETSNLTEGRYVYDVLVTIGSSTYPLVRGNVNVFNTISS
jgi:hypothetical protein|tara:strand:+ start:2984 stop:3364 length:381 start_codon:yes stop_codon:yes gene_type:complete